MLEKQDYKKSWLSLNPNTPNLIQLEDVPTPPPTNSTLSIQCFACGWPVERRDCKVGCPKCGFHFDCDQL